MAKQAESVYVISLLKSICMSEIEEENPRYTQFVEGFKIRRNELFRPRFFALKAFDTNGGPIDHLVSKKHALDLMKTVSLVG